MSKSECNKINRLFSLIAHKTRTFFPPSFVSVCIIFSLRHCLVSVCEFAWPVLSFLCTDARPEICPSAKNIRIPAQEGWLGFWAARAEGQRAGGEERRGEVKTAEEEKERKGKEGRGERLFWAISQQPDSDQSASRLVPSVQWSRERRDCPVIGTALSIRKTGPEHSADPPFFFKNSKLKNKQLHAKTKILLNKKTTLENER